VFPSGGEPQAPAFLRFLADLDARKWRKLLGSWVTPRSPTRRLHRADDLYGTSRYPAGFQVTRQAACSPTGMHGQNVASEYGVT
jgi:hypothetical protein